MPRAMRVASSSAAGAISNPLPPDDDQVQTSAVPARRLVTTDAIGDHEGRVEADAELADQAGAVLGLGQPGEKGFGAGTRDGAEIVDQLLPVHADAVVDHRKRAGLLVGLIRIFGGSPSAVSSGAAIAS